MAKFFAIGVGPGDPELLTIKAVNILRDINLLIVPVSAEGKRSIALETVSAYLPKNTIIKEILFPMVKNTDVYEKTGEMVARIVENVISEGGNCAYITIGDPMIYSTFGYIKKALNKNIETVIIPGIPSFCSAAAASGLMLAEKDQIISIVPMTARDDRIDNAVSASDTAVYMKVYNNLHKIKQLTSRKEYTLISNCGLRDEKVTDNV